MTGVQRHSLEIRLLGRFSITSDGQPVQISSRTAQLLLAYLVLTAGSRHRRERLSALLWPDAEEEAGRQNLRNALWILRKALGAEHFHADKLTVGFERAGSVWVDVEALGVPGGGSLEELETGAGAYAGELLPGFYEEWVLLERTRLRGVFDALMTRLVEALLARGRARDARAWAETWISAGEAPEPAYRALMAANFALGDRTGVVAAYRRCVQALEEEFGAEPTSETEQLYRSLLERADGWTAEVGARVAPAGATGAGVAGEPDVPSVGELLDRVDSERPRVVGREQELADLLERLEGAFHGNGGVAFVVGEAGRGKSTLLAELSTRAQERWDQLVTAVGRCNALGGTGEPLLPVREVLDQLTGDLDARLAAGTLSRSQAQRLAGLTPASLKVLVEEGAELVGPLLRAEPLLARAGKHLDGALLERLRLELGREQQSLPASRESLFDACTRFLRRLSLSNPLLVVLEDMHWADPSSIGLLFSLARNLAGSRLMIVGSFRSEDLALEDAERISSLKRTIAELERLFGDMTVDLDRGQEDRSLIDQLVDSEPNRLGEEFRTRLAHVTGGNALFAVELLSEMKANGGLERDVDGAWRESQSLDWRMIPVRIEGVIRARVDRLRPDLREALTIASVEGEVFTAEAVAKVVGTDERVLIRSLGIEAGQRHHLVEGLEVVRGIGRRTTFRFRHNLFRQYLYGTLSPLDRSILHEEMGQALEALAGAGKDDMAFALAYHFTEAGMPERAVPYLRLAGSRAISLSAHGEAAGHLRRALELVASLPEGEEKDREELEVRLLLGSALQALSGFSTDEVGETYGRAAQLADRLGAARQRFSALWSLTLFHSQRAEHDRTRAVSEELLDLATREGDNLLALQARHAQWSALFCLGDLEAVVDTARQGLAIYYLDETIVDGERYGGHDPGVCGHLFAARALWYLGCPDQARNECGLGLTIAANLNNPNSIAHAYAHAAELHLLRGEGGRARELAEAAVAVAEKKGLKFWGAWGRMLRGCALIASGSVADGIEEALRGRSVYPAIGLLEEVTLRSRLAEAYMALGDHQAASHSLELAQAAAERVASGVWRAELLRLGGELRLLEEGKSVARARGDGPDARELLWEAVRTARENGARAIELRAATSLVRAAKDSEDLKEARSVLAEAFGRFSEGFDLRDLRQAAELLEST